MSAPRYVCARRIADGERAELLLAAQQGVEGFERLVAVKRVLPQVCEDRRFVRTFLREARSAAALHHPHVVAIHDVQRDEDAYAVIMEYLSGEDVGYIVGALGAMDGKIPVRYACRIAADIADGLHAAHDAVVVHGEVAPKNIIVTYQGVSKLVDFGVARAAESNPQAVPGTMRDKLPYLSPEQIQGDVADARSDLFSLGAVLHEMLTGRPLFSGPSQAAILKNVLERRIPPPSVYNPKVSPALDAIVLGLLEREPAARTPTAAALRDALEDLLDAGGNVSHKKLGAWLRDTLPERYRQRRAAEKAVARGVGDAAVPEGAPLPPLFDDADARAAVDVSGPMVAVGYEPPVPPPPRRSTLFGVGAAAAVIAGGAVAAVMLVLRPGGNAAPARPEAVAQPAMVADAAPVRAAPDATPRLADVGLLVHAVPDGVTVEIDGHVLPELAGEDGVRAAVPADTSIHVALTKSGYEPHVAAVRTPEVGTVSLYVTLARIEDDEDEDDGLLDDGTFQGGGHGELLAIPTVDAGVAVAAAPELPRSRSVVPEMDRPQTSATAIPDAPRAPAPRRARSSAPRLVPPKSVKRVSGRVPVLRVRDRELPAGKRAAVKLCIDDGGAVTSVLVLSKVPDHVGRELATALGKWRYRPYRDGGDAVAVCFAVNFTLETRDR